MEYKSKHTHGTLLVCLNKQRLQGHFCDVTLVAEGNVICVHRCILAAASDYFRARFLGDLGGCEDGECDMSSCPYHALDSVITFIYTGDISITLDTVEDLLKVADFLCMTEIKSFCADMLRRNLDVNTCVQIKALVDQYTLVDIVDDVMNFLVPRMNLIMDSPDTQDLPFNYIYSLLSDQQLNYICETQTLEFIFRWINHLPEDRAQYASQLIACVEFSYLGGEYIKNKVANSKDIQKILRPEQRKIIQTKLSQQEYPNRVDDVIICRSRSSGCQDCVKLMVYLISEDKWYQLNCSEPHLLDGVESMTCDLHTIYLLLSKKEDVCGYAHDAKTDKELWKVSLDKGIWSQMTSPGNLTGQSRFVPHTRGLYVIDRTGVIEKYDAMRNSWVNYSDPGFDNCPKATMYMFPMPMDRYIYLLRGYSEEHSTDFALMSFSLQRYDTDKYTWTTLAHIHPGDIELNVNGGFHGYIATTSSLILKDAMGLERLKFNLFTGKASSVSPDVKPHKLITEIWGGAEHMDRVYFTVSTQKHGTIQSIRSTFQCDVLDVTQWVIAESVGSCGLLCLKLPGCEYFRYGDPVVTGNPDNCGLSDSSAPHANIATDPRPEDWYTLD